MPQEIHDALNAYYKRSTTSLNYHFETQGKHSNTGHSSMMSNFDPGYDEITTRVFLIQLMQGLPQMEQEIFNLYFYEGFTQSAIASLYGITQIKVSRILAKVRSHLKEAIVA